VSPSHFQEITNGRKRRAWGWEAPQDFEISHFSVTFLAKKGRFLSFENEKCNAITFAPSGKILPTPMNMGKGYLKKSAKVELDLSFERLGCFFIYKNVVASLFSSP